jgi:hypothetical protein
MYAAVGTVVSNWPTDIHFSEVALYVLQVDVRKFLRFIILMLFEFIIDIKSYACIIGKQWNGITMKTACIEKGIATFFQLKYEHVSLVRFIIVSSPENLGTINNPEYIWRAIGLI